MSTDPKAPVVERPTSGEIRAALRRILDSPQFEQAERSKAFLLFAVEETLAGRRERLRGHTIGVEVFGKAASFDASADPLVRVEAGRLRRRLAEYHTDAGAAARVRISLPRGSYVAEFGYAPDGHASRRSRWDGPRLVAYATSLCAFTVAAGVLAYGLSLRAGEPAAAGTLAPAPGKLPTTSAPTLLLSAIKNLSGDTALDRFGVGLTEELILKLNELSVTVITRLPGSSERALGEDSRLGGTAATYLLTGTTRGSVKNARISIRLVDVQSGEQLWAAAYDQRLARDALSRVEQSTAATIAAVVANPYGPLFAHELAKLEGSRPAKPGRADCLLRFFDYGRTLDPARHATAATCLNRVLLEDPDWAEGWGASALLAIDAWRFGYGAAQLSRSGLERALEHARAALDIDSANRLGNVALVLARAYAEPARHLGARLDRALELIPPDDLAARALLAQAFALSGDLELAVTLTAPSLDLGIGVPGWYRVVATLDALKNRDYTSALSTAVRIDSPAWFGSPLLEAAAAGLAGRTEIATRSITQLTTMDPGFATTGRAALRRWLRDEELVEIVAAGLSLAGLELP